MRLGYYKNAPKEDEVLLKEITRIFNSAKVALVDGKYELQLEPVRWDILSDEAKEYYKGKADQILTKAREVVEGVKKPYYHTTHKNLTYPCKACAFDEATKAALKALGGVNDGKD